jgi:hypothetical protein
MELVKALTATQGALSRRQLARLGLILLLMILASMLNPEGWRVYEYVWDVQSDPASQRLVTEWQSPSIRNPDDMPFFAAILLGFLAFVYSARRDPVELALFCAFAALGLLSLRSVVWFSLAFPPILAIQLSELDLTPIGAKLGRWRLNLEPSCPPPTHPVLNLTLLVLLVGITLLLSPWVRPAFSDSRLRSELIDPLIPQDAMEYVAQQEIRGPIFHSQNVGDYLIWRLHPQQRSFIDGRVHLYDVEFCRDYLRIWNGCGWEALLSQYGIEWVLLPLEEDGGDLLQQGLDGARDWSQVYRDDQTVLYHRKDPSGD